MTSWIAVVFLNVHFTEFSSYGEKLEMLYNLQGACEVAFKPSTTITSNTCCASPSDACGYFIHAGYF
jgi:hypothetical protein